VLTPDQIDQIVDVSESALDRDMQAHRITLVEYDHKLNELYTWARAQRDQAENSVIILN
jgi:hypothetical protein